MKTVVHSSSEIVQDLFEALEIPYENCSSLAINFTAGELVTAEVVYVIPDGALKSLTAILVKEKITTKLENDDTK